MKTISIILSFRKQKVNEKYKMSKTIGFCSKKLLERRKNKFYGCFHTNYVENKCNMYTLLAEIAIKKSWCPMCCENEKKQVSHEMKSQKSGCPMAFCTAPLRR